MSTASLRGGLANSALHHPGGARRRHEATVVVRASYEQDPAVGSKVEKWLQTPFDVLSFGPRATFGALVSLPTRLQTLQQDVEKVVELIQDPRPIDEKQTLVLKEIEDSLVEFLDKGATIETDILANIKTVLPPEAAATLTEIIPQPPNAARATVVEPIVVEPPGTSTSSYSSGSSYSSVSGVTPAPPPPQVTYSQSDVFTSQVASEITEIKNAVMGLKAALEDVRSNTDVSRVNMLRLKLREARDQLFRRVQEISPTTSNDPSVAAATREATILLEEVDAQFF